MWAISGLEQLTVYWYSLKNNSKTDCFNVYNKLPGESGSLGNNDIHFIYRDSKNRMWLCTTSGGLNLAIGTQPLNR